MEPSITWNTAACEAEALSRNWSMKQWADNADVSDDTLRQFLAGDKDIKIKTIERIVRPFGWRAAQICVPDPSLVAVTISEQTEVPEP